MMVCQVFYLVMDLLKHPLDPLKAMGELFNLDMRIRWSGCVACFNVP